MKKITIVFTIVFLAFIVASFVSKSTITKEELGQQLFFDPILSRDSTISCASCHKPEFAFADTSAVSIGHGGARGKRNTPSSMNLILHENFFWDGRAKGLEEQALIPIENPVEMNLPIEEALERLNRNSKYNGRFKAVFNKRPDRASLAAALAAFERTLETSNSSFDEWKFSDDPAAISDRAKRGFHLFNTKANCVKCHFGADLTANEFRNIGLFNGKNLNDSGRIVVTGKAEDLGRFKTPSLRNVALTAPYMHNGILPTLKDVIEFYNDPGKLASQSINRDSLMIKPLQLTEQEKDDLLAFLNSLTDKRFLVHNK
ncbi:MAG: c-type cytochrome [Chitinophagaceae bacterium]|nr:c-type cytochrome [Chitinophagaceae bacterium]